MALGNPVINVPRNGDLRAMVAALDAANQRIKAIEDAIAALPEQTLSALMQQLYNSPSGFVVKKGNTLTTRTLGSGNGVSIKNGDGQKGDPIIGSP